MLTGCASSYAHFVDHNGSGFCCVVSWANFIMKELLIMTPSLTLALWWSCVLPHLVSDISSVRHLE